MDDNAKTWMTMLGHGWRLFRFVKFGGDPETFFEASAYEEA